jgi:hypothetical protein
MAESSTAVDAGSKMILVDKVFHDRCSIFAGKLLQFALEVSSDWPDDMTVHEFLELDEPDSTYFKWLRAPHDVHMSVVEIQ